MRNLISRRLVVWTIAFGCLCFLSINHCAHAQSTATEEITVVGEEVPSAYGAPPAFSRSPFYTSSQRLRPSALGGLHQRHLSR